MGLVGRSDKTMSSPGCFFAKIRFAYKQPQPTTTTGTTTTTASAPPAAPAAPPPAAAAVAAAN